MNDFFNQSPWNQFLPAAPRSLNEIGPVLIAGYAGVPGYNAFHFFRRIFGDQVWGAYSRHNRCIYQQDNLIRLPDSQHELIKLFRKLGIRSVIDATGTCALKSCEHNPAMAHDANVAAGSALARCCATTGARLIRLSTDLVFDGNPYSGETKIREGGYTEDHPTSPVTVYGVTMVEAEKRILSLLPESTIFRISLPMGPSANGHAGAVDWISSRFKKGLFATLFFDEVRSNLYVQDLNRILLASLFIDAPGIFHLGGPRPLSLFRIAQIVNRVGGFDSSLLKGCPRNMAPPIPPRAGNVTLDSSRLFELLPNFRPHPWPMQYDLVPEDDQWHLKSSGKGDLQTMGRFLYGYDFDRSPFHPLHLLSPKLPESPEETKDPVLENELTSAQLIRSL